MVDFIVKLNSSGEDKFNCWIDHPLELSSLLDVDILISDFLKELFVFNFPFWSIFFLIVKKTYINIRKPLIKNYQFCL